MFQSSCNFFSFYVLIIHFVDVYKQPYCFINYVGVLLQTIVIFNQNDLADEVLATEDCPLGGDPTYMIESTNPAIAENYFKIHQSNGQISLKIPGVTIPVGEYTVFIRCDVSPEFDFSTYQFLRKEQNEYAPLFTHNTTLSLATSKSKKDSVLLTLNATDKDLGVFGNISYSLSGNQANALFSIDSYTGELTLIESNFEYSQYNLTVTAQTKVDGESSVSNSATAKITVFINFAPSFSQSLYSSSQPENKLPPTGFITVKCTDPDTASNELVYSLKGKNSDSFSITSNGQLISEQIFDYDDGIQFYQFTVVCSDSTETDEAVIQIDVQPINEHKPTIKLDGSGFQVKEESALPEGFLVASATQDDALFQIIATDDDAGIDGKLSFTVEGLSDYLSPFFAINSTNGDLYLEKDMDVDGSGEPLLNMAFSIKVCDTGGLCVVSSPKIILLLTVADEIPMFDEDTHSVSLYEEDTSALFTPKLTIKCTDADVSIGEIENVELYNPSSDIGDYISLYSSKKGNEITTDISLKKTLDYELNITIDFQLICYDAVNEFAITNATINVLPVNDLSPIFTEVTFIFNISRTAPAGESYIVGVVSATDGDIDVGNDITYSIAESSDVTQFSINNNGEVILEESLNKYPEDYIVFTVEAADNDKLHKDTATVFIEIEAGNYEKPRFTGEVQVKDISELEPTGTSVLSVFCNDTEEGDNGLVSYEIYGGNTGGAFRIDNATGEIFVNNLLILPQGEEKVTYTLSLKCTDNGIPRLSDFGSAIIRVFKADIYHPDIKNETIITFLDENVDLNHLVVTITAEDLDTEELNYYFEDESEKGAFIITPNNGEVRVNSKIDRESIPEYSMTVYAEEVLDELSPDSPKNDSAAFFIYIRDINDNSPDCGVVSDTVEIKSTLKKDETVYQLSCEDKDVGNNGNLSYTLSNDYGVIGIDISGRIYLQKSLNNSNTSTFYLEITVADQPAEDPISIDLTILVVVLSSNENKPSFTNLPSTINVTEDSSTFNSIFTVMAEDSDRGLHGVVRFKLLEQSSLPFKLIPNTGELYLTESLDYFNQSSYTLNISASDPEFTVYETLKINVLDVNEFEPECASTLFTKSIVEETNPIDVTSIVLGCTDEDKGSSGELIYQIIDGDEDDSFSVHDDSLVLSKPLDFETKEEYDLEIMISDLGNPSKSTTVSVKIQVLAVNEDTPSIFQSQYSKSVKEGTEIGFTVLTVEASDDDGGIQGDLTYSLEPTQTNFGITNKGVLLVTGGLDHEEDDSYSFNVIVKDGGTPPKSSSASIDITIIDIDDNPPSFTKNLYTNTVESGDAVLNSLVAMVNCTDPDSKDNANVSYSLVTSDSTQYFTISSNGDITISQSLPLSSIYSFGVTCSGVLNPNFTDTAQVSITILVESNITFSKATYTASLPENATTGTFLTINASSATDTTLRYKLIDAPTIFQISQQTGDLMLVGQLDYESTESYVLKVEASDSGAPPSTATVAVNILVENVNDESPYFVTSASTVTVEEEKADYNSLGTYQCDDADEGIFGMVTYTLSGDENNHFKVDKSSGELLLNSAVDYEEVQSLTLQITCADGGTPPKSSVLSVPVAIEAVNEFAPQFSSDTVELSVAESVPVPSILTLSDELEASDDDLSPHNSIFYSIISGNDDNTFFISSSEGSLSLVKKLDYETISSYTITVLADDSGGVNNPDYPVLNSTVDVQVIVSDDNDNSPMFDKDVYVGSLSESSEVEDHVEMVTLICTDKDSGSNGEITITIVEGNEDGIFEVDNSNGKVVLKKKVDFESDAFYTLTVRCSDKGATPKFDDASLTINIEDHSEYGPVFEQETYEFSVNETVSPGFMVGKVVAVDADQGTTGDITYSGDIDGPFAIDTDSGVITVSVPLDYEDPPTSFVFNVTAEDTTKQKDVTIVAINILNIDDNLPNFPYATYYGTINENSSPGQTVHFDPGISCSDADDEADNIAVTYLLESTDTIPFAIDENDGSLTSNNLLDLETIDRYSFEVYCFDSGNSNVSAVVTIDIKPYNDFAPNFLDTPYSTTIAEDIVSDSIIFTVSATDKDKISFNDITYAISSGNDGEVFEIDSKSGVIRVTGGIDYEEATNYTLEISATNIIPDDDVSGSPTLVSYTDIYINITDVNDNDPVLTPASAYVIVTNETAGFHLVTMTCEDADSGNFGETTISLTGANAFQFELLSNGTIITKNLITSNLILQVNCSDMGSPPRYTIADISVATDDSNDYFPQFESNTVTFDIFENHTVGEEVGCHSATDQDGTHKPSGILTYTLTLQEGEDHFTVNKDTGCVFVSTALDYDDGNKYVYKIRATDGGLPAKFADAIITINVKNVEFDPPQFSETLLARQMSENLPVGALVTKILTCTDRDDGDVITYSISSGNDNGLFSVDNSTGEVVLAKTLDYEMATSHLVTLQCTDPSNLYDSALISITVLPVNEHTPLITEKSVTVDEESPVGTEITIIDYTDQDDGVDGQVVFEIIDDENTGIFAVISDILYVNQTLDRETNKDPFEVDIRVTDKADIPRSSTGTITVTLSDINDNPPLPLKSIYVTDEVNATVKVGFVVEMVNCTDADEGINAKISFSIETNSLLDIDSATGIVTVKGDLRKRDKHTIALEITCTDKGVPSLSSSFPIQVPIIDPNIYDPVFLKPLYSVSLPENNSLLENFVNVTAKDDDIGLNGKIQYTLVDDYDNLFYIDSETGEISLLTELDYETVESYSIEVLAIDGSDDSPLRRTGTTTVQVNVTGVNEFTPECKQPIYTAIISAEDTGPVLKLNCADSDKGNDGVIDYSISPSKHSNLFSVNSSGWISIPSSILANASIEVYEIFVVVTDMGKEVKSYEVEANFIYSFENMNLPVFNESSYSATVSESAPIGKVILTVHATDQDPGLQGDIEYSVSGTNYFRVNPQSGEIYISEELDYEKQSKVVFTVIASDLDPKEPLSSNVTVQVEVTDVNDNSPVCGKSFYSTEIGSSLVTNETVFNVSGLCEDADGPQNSKLTYLLNPTDTFRIDSNTGIIFVNGPLTAGLSKALTVTVTDSGVNALRTNITVSIIVRFDNVEPPKFANETYLFSVLEDADLLTLIGQVVASDADSANDDITYTLQTKKYEDLFYIDPKSGDIILTDFLDYESITQYSVTIAAQDSGSHDGSNKLSDTTVVIINVDNVNDNSPVLSDNGLYGATVNKTTPVNQSIIQITCTDSDSAPYASPRIVNHGFDADVPFKLVGSGSEEWEIQVSSDLTVLNGSVSYEVNFTCRDGGGIEVTGRVFLSVPELNAPVFNQSVYEWNVREDAESGAKFSQISAESLDSSVITYEIIDGNTENLFYIHPHTGIISLTGTLDYEEQTSYALVIQATDGKKRSTTVLLRVFVVNIDDNIPLVPPSAFLTIEHYREHGYPVGTVKCVDDDYIGGNFSFSFVESSDEFAIDDNGLVTVQSMLDSTPVYVLPVTCYDKTNPEAVSTGIITVEVIFVNLYEPEFELSSYQVSVQEDVTVNSIVTTVNATDDDIGNLGKISYSISNGNEDKFYIDTETGDILVLTSLDREEKETYILTVEATDGGVTNITARKTGSTTVNIHILDVNDNNPSFTQQSYLATILTNRTIFSNVLQVQCDDADSGVNGQFEYSIQPLHESFVINTNGTVSLVQEQADETVYNFYVYCTDLGDPALSSSALVTIAVNKNEFGDPVFTNDSYSVTIPENKELLDLFLTVTATVDNQNVEIVYSIIAGNMGDTFTINSDSGELSLLENLDYATQSSYTLTVQATTSGFVKRSSQVLVSVLVTDVNDNEPMFFPLLFYVGNVDENDDIKTPVVQVNCTDDDPTDVLTYSLSGDVPDNGEQYFDITENGLVTIKQSLDYETTAVYTLNVQCSDGENSADATVRVDVGPINEFTPVFLEKVYKFTADENTEIGTTLGYVNATDDDEGIHGEITFLLDDLANLSPIFINPSTGEILISTLLDYEEQTFYNLSVIGRDSGGSESYVPLEITVNNLDDVDPVLTPTVTTYKGRVPTDSPDGLFIEYFSCIDPDGGDTSITIISGNEQGYFRLNSFNQLVWNGTSDVFMSDIVVTIMLKCTDEAGDEDTASIAVVVGKPDVDPPTFSQETFSESLEENATLNTIVLTVTAVPSVSNHSIEYSLFSLGGIPFAIDTESGLITVNGSLDYENVDLYTFPVQAKDVDDGSIALATVEITVLDVNDNKPVILPSSLTVYIKEDASTGISYAKFTCSDEDSNDNSLTSFLIDNGDPSMLFSISGGSVYLQNSLDFENTTSHNITVSCVDNGDPQLTAYATLLVQVTGVNEFYPTFNMDAYNFTTQENSSLGSFVGSVEATDKDDGTNGQFHYEVYGGGGSDYFRVDENNGDILVNSFLNASVTDSLSLVVAATDNGPPSPLIGTVVVGIDISDKNEEPYFSQLSYVASIATDTAIPGDTLGTVKCFDYDLGSNAELTLSIVKKNDLVGNVSLTGGLKGSESVSADLVLNTTITAGSYEVIVQCVDSGNPSLSANASFVVNVKGVNTAPSFDNTHYGLSLHEDTETDKSLLKVTATDVETEVSFALLGGIGLGTFQINEDNGEISLLQALDYETTTSYTLTVGAIDKDELNPKTGSATIAITVVNVNDNNPTISPPTFSATLNEGDYTSHSLRQFTCQDADGGETSFSVSPDPPFDISTEGFVTFTGKADYESSKTYTVTVTCTDSAIAGGDLQKEATATLSVSITPVNFDPPELTSDNVFNVSEGSEVGSVILTLTASDPDGRGEISFDTDSHTDLFTLNSQSGELVLVDELDRETTDSYSLTVAISDGDTTLGVSPMTTTTQITVNVVDINDNSPTCTSTLETITISAGTYNKSLSLYNASCSDKDIGNNSILEYSLEKGSLPSEGEFVLNSETGQLSFQGTITKDSSTSVINIIVSDKGKDILSTSVEIQLILTIITGDEPYFDPDRFSVNISEALPPLQVFFQGQNFKDALKNTDEDPHFQFSTNTTIFLIDQSSGNVLLLSSDVLDYDEGLQMYSLGIQANVGTDAAEAILDVILLDYNDNSPKFSTEIYNGSVTENLDESEYSSTVILTVSAEDIDSNENAEITYSISTGGDSFEIDKTSGAIKSLKSFDREEIPVYSLIVVAKDNGSPPQSSSASVSIAIGDENDNPPTFAIEQYIVTVADNSKTGTVLETIVADDPDIQGILKYALISEDSNLQTFIDIDPETGQLLQTDEIPFNHKLIYTFKVTANDQVHTDQTNVVLQIATVSSLEFSWVENVANQTEDIFQFLKGDYNISVGAEYTIIEGDSYGHFEIIGNGILTHTVLLDRENISFYTIDILVNDNKTDESFIVKLSIDITDANDNAPKFEYERYEFNISEGHYNVRTIIGNVRAFDDDAENTVNSRIEYFLVDNTGEGFFDASVNIITGDISVFGSIDREFSDHYILAVEAEDNGEPKPLIDIAYVHIYLSDVNDNAPQFVEKNLVKFIIYFAINALAGTPPHLIVAENSFRKKEIDAIEFIDPDISDSAIAKLSGSEDFTLLNNTSPLTIVTLRDVTYSLNGTMLLITLSDGLDTHEETTPVLVMVIEPITTTMTPTRSTSQSAAITRSTSDPIAPTIDPTREGAEDFVRSPLGIAIVVVGSVMVFAILFFFFCLVCYCYQRYQSEQEKIKR